MGSLKFYKCTRKEAEMYHLYFPKFQVIDISTDLFSKNDKGAMLIDRITNKIEEIQNDIFERRNGTYILKAGVNQSGKRKAIHYTGYGSANLFRSNFHKHLEVAMRNIQWLDNDENEEDIKKIPGKKLRSGEEAFFNIINGLFKEFVEENPLLSSIYDFELLKPK